MTHANLHRCLAWVLALFACGARPSGTCAADVAEEARQFEVAKARAIRNAVAAIAPSMVTIETVGGAQPVRQGMRGPVEESFRVADGPTTGLLLSDDGLILASSFNFARDPSIITVRLSDGRRFVATLLARDQIRRLALLRIEAENLSAARWVPAGEIQVGQYSIACGHGLGASQPFASLGIVSAVGRRNGIAIQTDAKTSPINYGGPLIDLDGRVLGLIVPIAGAGGGALAGVGWYDSGIGFAIPRDCVDDVLSRLRKGENIEPGKIGVVLAPLEEDPLDEMFRDLFPSTRGVRIAALARPSPAERAELQAGDIILELEGRPISDVAELQRKLSDRAAGEKIVLKVKRRWRTLDVAVLLAAPKDIGPFDTPEEEEEAGADDAELPPGDDDSNQPTTQPEGD